MSLRQHCTQDHGGRLRLSCLRLEHLFTRAEKGDKARKMCATDIGNSILLKVYTRHHLLNIKAHRILYSFNRRTSQAQTWWAPRINNFNQLEKKKKGQLCWWQFFLFQGTTTSKTNWTVRKCLFDQSLLAKNHSLHFPFRQKCFETSRHLTFYRLYPENFFCLFFQTGVIALIEYKTKHKLNNIYFLHLKTLVRSKECRCDKSFLHIFIRE